MSTTSKTWVFAADAEGLAEDGDSANIAFAWDGADGNAAGSIKFSTSATSISETEQAKKTSTADTWETWGIPAGGVVTAIKFLGSDGKAILTADVFDVCTYRVRVVDSTGATIAAELFTITYVGSSGGWVASGVGISQSVGGSHQASTTSVRLEVDGVIGTGTTAGARSIGVDNISIEMTYTFAAVNHYLGMVPLHVPFDTGPTPLTLAGVGTLTPAVSPFGFFFGQVGTYESSGGGSGSDSVGAGPMQVTPVINLPVMTPAGDLKFSHCRDGRGANWTTEVAIRAGVDGNSAGGEWLQNKWLALYSVANDVNYKSALTAEDWTVSGEVAMAVTGKVWGLARNDQGVLCALIDNRVYLCPDAGVTWSAGPTISDLGTFQRHVVANRHMFIIVRTAGEFLKHYVSVDGGASFV